MTFAKNAAAGAAFASLEISQTLARALLHQGVVPAPIFIELLEQNLLRIETMQAGMGGEGEAADQYKAARLHLTMFIDQLRKMPTPE